jgi:hypothetical protein
MATEPETPEDETPAAESGTEQYVPPFSHGDDGDDDGKSVGPGEMRPMTGGNGERPQ